MQGSTEAANTRDGLYRRARQLEADALEAGDDGPIGRMLRSQAADLRHQALGDRLYPIVTCAGCFRLTGWVDASGFCDACLRHEQRQAAYGDAHSGWVPVSDEREPGEPLPGLPLRARLAALAGLRGALDRAIVRVWLSGVEPDDTGPVEPEAGYELEMAHRDEVYAADGSGLVVRFSTATHRFGERGWLRLESTRISRWDTMTPAEFSAALPIEQLAEAWGDYGAEIVAFNRGVWSSKSERREAARQALAERRELLHEQLDVAELLDEGGAPER